MGCDARNLICPLHAPHPHMVLTVQSHTCSFLPIIVWHRGDVGRARSCLRFLRPRRRSHRHCPTYAAAAAAATTTTTTTTSTTTTTAIIMWFLSPGRRSHWHRPTPTAAPLAGPRRLLVRELPRAVVGNSMRARIQVDREKRAKHEVLDDWHLRPGSGIKTIQREIRNQ
jgi:hypothetical protein